jgi:high-affinity K+ transport system ATPase subunit B
MAGTLTVQNLQGPSSGANANKIIVPSGQTIDASAGTLVPSAGQVVQMVTRVDTSSAGTSSSSYVSSGIYIDITPVYDDSTIVVTFIGTSYTTGDGQYVIYRDSTSLESTSQAQTGVNATIYTPATLSAIDTPNTTSTVRYTIYYKATLGNIYWPPGSLDTTQCIATEIKQ